MTIYRTLLRNNIVLRDRGETVRLPVDHNYFEKIDHQDKAYWIGFLLADGGVFGNEITINLQARDYKHLKRFKTCLKSQHKLKKIISSFNSHQYRFKFRSTKMVQDLSKWGVIPNKSLVVNMPKLPEKYVPHLVRGIFDGDGCISSYMRGNNITYGFTIVGASKSFMLSLKQLFVDSLGPKFGNFYTQLQNGPKGKNPLYIIAYQGNIKVKTICDWIYNDANIKLDRKYKLYLKLKKQMERIRQNDR